MIKKIAVIVAAGSGTRMGSETPKQFLLLQNKPVLWHSIAAFQRTYDDMEIRLVISAEYLSVVEEIRRSALLPDRIKLIAGGKTRFESVRNGLRDIPEEETIVFVHDGVRCLTSKDLIERCFSEAKEKGTAVPIVPARDSLRIESAKGLEVIDRNKIRIIQTPQVFRAHILIPAFGQEYSELFTDESTVVESYGRKVHFIPGEETNIKITLPVDLRFAEIILAERVAQV